MSIRTLIRGRISWEGPAIHMRNNTSYYAVCSYSASFRSARDCGDLHQHSYLLRYGGLSQFPLLLEDLLEHAGVVSCHASTVQSLKGLAPKTYCGGGSIGGLPFTCQSTPLIWPYAVTPPVSDRHLTAGTFINTPVCSGMEI